MYGELCGEVKHEQTGPEQDRLTTRVPFSRWSLLLRPFLHHPTHQTRRGVDTGEKKGKSGPGCRRAMQVARHGRFLFVAQGNVLRPWDKTPNERWGRCGLLVVVPPGASALNFTAGILEARGWATPQPGVGTGRSIKNADCRLPPLPASLLSEAGTHPPRRFLLVVTVP